MIIVGVDPGYERLGVAVIEKHKSGNDTLIYSTCIRSSKSSEFADRLLKIGSEFEDVLRKYQPSICGIEKVFMNTNQKTAIRVASAKGVIMYASRRCNAKVLDLTPLQIKEALTGYGRADKSQVQFMVGQLLPGVSLDKKLDDEVDAIAVALATSAYCQSLQFIA